MNAFGDKEKFKFIIHGASPDGACPVLSEFDVEDLEQTSRFTIYH